MPSLSPGRGTSYMKASTNYSISTAVTLLA